MTDTSRFPFSFGYVPTPAEWQEALDGKQDALGYTPFDRAGGTLYGRLITSASTTVRAGFNITPGIAPASPLNGDIWFTAAAAYLQVGGKTVQIGSGSGGGTVTNPFVLPYTAGSTISGQTALMFEPGSSSTVVPADPTNAAYVFAGIALAMAASGASVVAQITADIEADQWSWTPDQPVFVAPNGALTQTPPTSGVSHLIGRASSATVIRLAPEPPVTIIN